MPAVVCLNYEEYRTICCVSDKSQFVGGCGDLEKIMRKKDNEVEESGIVQISGFSGLISFH